MTENSSDTQIYMLLWVVAIIVLFLLLVGLSSFVNGFSRQLKYLNSEIGRTTGSERRYWIRKRRRLWLSLIPFVKY